MPDLPVLTVSQPHFDRIVAAFPGATLTAKAVAYKAWLTNVLIDEVQRVEADRIRQAAEVAAQAELKVLLESLPPRPPYPPPL